MSVQYQELVKSIEAAVDSETDLEPFQRIVVEMDFLESIEADLDQHCPHCDLDGATDEAGEKIKAVTDCYTMKPPKGWCLTGLAPGTVFVWRSCLRENLPPHSWWVFG